MAIKCENRLENHIYSFGRAGIWESNRWQQSLHCVATWMIPQGWSRLMRTVSMEQSPWEVTNHWVKKFTDFYGTRMFITAFTKTHHWPLSWASCIQSPPSRPFSLRSVLILSFRLRLVLPSALSPSGLPTKILYAFVILPMRATCPAHLIILELLILIIFGEAYKV